jgi:LuxR family maltose regulon positive regulatory protein
VSVSPDLLTAKFSLPPARPRARLVVRPRLLARLDSPCPVTLITAPAGFGKTTLAAEWAHAAPAGRAAWLGLDADDNDPARWLTYLIAALGQMQTGLGAAALAQLQSPQAPLLDGLLTLLANELGQLPAPAEGEAGYVLILDDYHAITAQAVHTAVAFLLDHLPTALRVVITSRSEPEGLPLARWRARGQLAEVRADDLRFTPEEADHFLREVMGLPLTPSDGAALTARTEGWVAGLQLAALAALAAQAQAGPDALAAAFDAGHPYLGDYLLAEVITQQPPERQVFLRRVSMLERLTGPLCDAVTGGQDGDALLDHLARANLFLARGERDAHGEWFRFHQLFREFLRQQLAQQEPDRAAELHRRASAWYEQHDLTDEAVSHALAAGEGGTAARLIAAAAPGWQARGEFGTLRQWLERLPPEAVWANPRLCIARAWMLLDADLPRQAEADLARLDEFLARQPSAALEGETLALRAVFAAVRRQPAQALVFAQQAEQHAPTGDAFVQPYVAFGLGAAYKMGHDSIRAEQFMRHAGALAAAAGHTYLAYSAFGNLGDIQFNTGRMTEAAQSNQRALQYIESGRGPEPHYAGWIHWAQARIHYEWNELEQALAEAEQATALCAQWGNLNMGVRGHLVRAQVMLARRQLAEARGTLDEAEHLARQAGDARIIAGVTRQRVSLALAGKDLEQARQWAATLPELPDDQYRFVHALCLARLALAAGQPGYALDYLGQARQALETTDRVNLRLQVLILEAVARRARGQAQQAQVILERALTIGQPGGFVRSFVDEGAPIQELLRRSAANGAAAQGPLAEYVQRLLAAPAGQRPAPAVRLTRRERQILRLMASGLSNRAMSEQLVVAEATLKRHVSNLYLKLDVHSRTQALARAADLKLL